MVTNVGNPAGPKPSIYQTYQEHRPSGSDGEMAAVRSGGPASTTLWLIDDTPSSEWDSQLREYGWNLASNGLLFCDDDALHLRRRSEVE